ncbi:MAG: hypothetical protein MI864_01635 [Pseudomonadales bacterium]|nr:hypothetical protein [Pseudomonadales bacterium]
MRVRVKWLKRLLIAMVVVSTSVVYALPKEHEMNRLMLAVEKYVSEQSWQKANQTLQDILALNTAVPTEFAFYQGRVLMEFQSWENAKIALEKYVVEAGTEGGFYRNALEQLTVIEEHLREGRVENSVDQAPATASDSEALGQREDQYLSDLKSLYLTSDEQVALLRHINSLLANHSYQGQKIKRKVQSSGIAYKVSVDQSKDLLIQEKVFNADEGVKINLKRMSVFGVDPILRYGCDKESYVCWLYDPVDGYDRWLLIDRDDGAASELATALSRLIRRLQN